MPQSIPGGDTSPPAESEDVAALRLPAESVRWRCDPARLPFDTTEEIEPARSVVGQDNAVDAVRFGLECYAPGQNIFIRGLTGTGRMTLVRQLLEHIRPACPLAPDRCYVHNFEQRDRPVLITLPRGRARAFARRVDELIRFIREDLVRALSDEAIKSRQDSMQRSTQDRIRKILQPFEDELKEAGLALVTVQAGPVAQGALYGLIDGEPTPPEEIEEMHNRGDISDEQFQDFVRNHEKYNRRLKDISHKIIELGLAASESMERFIKREARSALERLVERIKSDFLDTRVERFLDEVVEDVVENRLSELQESSEFTRLYKVNALLEHAGETCPTVVENTPTVMNLLGSIDREPAPGGGAASDHTMIHAGSILRADGGYLILDARDVLTEPGAWKVLTRTLRTGRLEIMPPELSLSFIWAHSLKPEPIDVNVKVILLGDAHTYYLLQAVDPDFAQLFKVLADFDNVIPRTAEGLEDYSAVIAKVAAEEKLPAFDRTAVAALIEHGARIAARRQKLTARFSRLADIAREAAFIAGKENRGTVTGEDVNETIRRTKRRADLPSRKFHEYLADGTIRIQTTGRTVGQMNGLAVLTAGQLTYGFPARITATIGAGSAGVINIEREADLSGAIHTKGFYILGGLLRHLLQTDYPLAFTASIAFEQSYGGIDGDSASGAEICCLLSALTGVPIRQDMAMTGAIDQLGHVLAIGAVNEKIEGFYDTCEDIGLTGSQGVIIPKANALDLMLRQDVVDACAAGRFHVYAVENVRQALEILTGVPAGERDEMGEYPAESLLGKAVERARRFWTKAAQAMRQPVSAAITGEEPPESD
ncbi:MAG: ATP-binding protein [Planctomycetota bacterium]|nr:ATP-binding protein [Planctomycetota bacterium]